MMGKALEKQQPWQTNLEVVLRRTCYLRLSEVCSGGFDCARDFRRCRMEVDRKLHS